MKTIKLEELKNNGAYEINVQVAPIETKIAYATTIADSVCKELDNGIGVIDEVMKVINIKLYAVMLYTNIKLDNVGLEEYDLLNQCGVFDKITKSNNDYYDFVSIVNASCKDKEKEYSLDKIAAQRMKDGMNALLSLGSHLEGILDRTDPNKLTKYLSKSVEMIAKKMPDYSTFEKFDMNKVKKELN